MQVWGWRAEPTRLQTNLLLQGLCSKDSKMRVPLHTSPRNDGSCSALRIHACNGPGPVEAADGEKGQVQGFSCNMKACTLSRTH